MSRGRRFFMIFLKDEEKVGMRERKKKRKQYFHAGLMDRRLIRYQVTGKRDTTKSQYIRKRFKASESDYLWQK